MSFFTKIKKCLGFSNSKLSEINKIVDKKLREGDRKHWLSISDPKKCLEEKSNEIFEELKKKKNSLGKQYSMKEIKKATTERSRYWANNFNKSRNLIEFELASLCSYLRKLQQKMSNRTFSVLIKIICDRDFLSYENSITLPLFIILLHFFKTKSLIDPKHGNSLLKSYLTLLTQKKSLKGFKDILESLERFFGNENDEISTLIKTLNNKYQNELGTTSIKEIKYGKEK
ncbi:MAG: hypothetical protein FWC41_07040, partial [Firmicutes bacterium]|nr:hypothetical protein [Bacillota bacterium]